MVQAILAGRKTMTRRTKGLEYLETVVNGWPYKKNGVIPSENGMPQQDIIEKIKCPYGKVGDVLWVRETWCQSPRKVYCYKASTDADSEDIRQYYLKSGAKWAKWKPSIHMPKAAARIFLQISNIRVERLQDISRQDCINEGIAYIQSNGQKRSNIPGSWYDYERKTFASLPSGKISPSMSFRSLWRSINGKQSWNDNPWVWVVEFKRINR